MLLSEQELNRIFNLVSKFEIHLNDELATPNLLWATLEERTYHRNGLQRVPLPNGLGQCAFANDIKFDEIQNACRIYEERKTNNERVYEYRYVRN